MTGIHRQGSTSKTQDFIGSEIREKAAYTWQVIDNGKVGGAVLKARATREINELTCRKLEANVSRELSRIANDLKGIDARERSLSAASVAAEESANALRENVATGLASPLDYRVSQNAFLTTRSGLLEAIYQHNVAIAEWDRASGRYFQFWTTTQNRGRRSPLKRRNASEHFDTARPLQQLPSACALQAGGFNSLSLIERPFPLWCLGNSVFELLPRREVENENAWAPVYCKEASRIPH